ncbi:MAG: type II secretion system F family protein [Pseudomonadota bacterium]
MDYFSSEQALTFLSIAAAVFFLSITCIIFLFIGRRAAQSKLKSRLDSMTEKGKAQISKTALFQYERETLLQKKFKRYHKGSMSQTLKQRGIRLSPIVFFSLFFAATVLLAMSIQFSLELGMLTSSVVSFVFLGLSVNFYLSTVKTRQEQAFLMLFPVALDIISRGLRAGTTVEKTFMTVAQEVEAPIGPEFATICKQINFGMPFEDALRASVDRVQVKDYAFFVVALIIQRRTGGSLSELVGNISAIIRRRQELKLKIKALSSEARATGMIVGSLPFLAMLGMLFFSPDYIETFQKDPAGRKLMALAMGLILTCVIVIRRMVRFRI